MLHYDGFYLKAFAEGPIVVVVVKLGCRAFASVPAFHSVIMERKSLHVVLRLFHQHIGPLIVVVACTGCNLIKMVSTDVAAISLIATIFRGIVFRSEVTSATPAFITYSEIFEFPRLFTTVCLAFLSHRTVFSGDVFHPLSKFLNSTTSYVTAQIWLTSNKFA